MCACVLGSLQRFVAASLPLEGVQPGGGSGPPRQLPLGACRASQGQARRLSSHCTWLQQLKREVERERGGEREVERERNGGGGEGEKREGVKVSLSLSVSPSLHGKLAHCSLRVLRVRLQSRLSPQPQRRRHQTSNPFRSHSHRPSAPSPCDNLGFVFRCKTCSPKYKSSYTAQQQTTNSCVVPPSVLIACFCFHVATCVSLCSRNTWPSSSRSPALSSARAPRGRKPRASCCSAATAAPPAPGMSSRALAAPSSLAPVTGACVCAFVCGCVCVRSRERERVCVSE